MMNEKIDIPVWEKYTLTIEEASRYFTIGQNKLRRLVEEIISVSHIKALSYERSR